MKDQELEARVEARMTAAEFERLYQRAVKRLLRDPEKKKILGGLLMKRGDRP